MTLPSLHITNGPGQRDLELAFIARHLGAKAKFTIFAVGEPLVVELEIFSFEFVSGLGPNYKLGGQLGKISSENQKKLPQHNWTFVRYHAENRRGSMEFSNGE